MRRTHSGVSDQSKASKHRLTDAQEIFQKAKRWRAAMYIGGYSIECLLKSRLMKQYGCDNLEQLEEELNRRQWLRVRHSVFTHSLELLLMLTGASDRLRSNAELWPHFQRVNQWIPAWRYAPDIGIGKDAAEFLDSVERVFHWIESNT